jgi:sugar phosphate isomerase/epimerase
MKAQHAFRSGLMSVTFRQKGIQEVVEIAVRAGLESITWAGDSHVPPDDSAALERARAACAAASVRVEGYGSYWRGDSSDFAPVLRAAQALGAGRVRIWAGNEGSEAASVMDRMRIVAQIAHAADTAAEAGIGLHLEFHRNTLTDSAESTSVLLDEIAALRITDDFPVRTYWQPRPGITTGNALAEISILGSQISAAHVFSWDQDAKRLPLKRHREQWLTILGALAEHPLETDCDQPRDLMLEFVRGDSTGQLLDDATELHRLVELTA